jgi:glucose/arabinose dehydrogenase
MRTRLVAQSAAALIAAWFLAAGACGGGGAQGDGTNANDSGSSTSTKTARRGVGLKRVGTFDEPTYVAAPPGDRRRVFVVEKTGRIRVLTSGKKASTPFLDLSGDVSNGGEQGLLSMAFAPDYARTGRFYVDFTDRNGDTRVQEFTRSRGNPNRANRASRRQVLFINQPFENHNGGLVLFGPDRLLYIGMGDGGSAGDPGNRAQNLDSLLGKILRIDPRRSGSAPYRAPSSNPFVGRPGRDEIYAYGFRNPWRFSFDPNTGALYIGDVGQDRFEEVDYEPRGAARGRDFGWSCFEARHQFNSSRRCPNPVFPVLEYPLHPACAVTGGVVVRDRRLPALVGRYLYADFCDGDIRSFRISGRKATGGRALGLHVGSLSSFGEDASRRVYVTSLDGPVYRLAPK